ncbi:MAG: hypothetical protein IPM54_15580 [Polyangiaceae bacterium]|nr:hypothetical protein [Polyangiaceae bacterium]
MRKYRIKAASDIRVTYGVELCEGLRHFPETDGYAASFEVLNNELDAAHNARRGLRKPMLQKRAAFRFAHYNTDQTIRMIHGAVGIADGGRKNGPIAKFLFPEGLGPVVAPYGMRQIPPTVKLVDDMKRCKVPGSEAFIAEWLPKLEASLDKLQTAANAYDSVRKAYLAAFADELALRGEHYQAVDKLMGLVRAAFPNDRARQDLVFPAVDEDSDDEGEGEGEG